ncbi:hypothetical protein [Melissospora conviva]|uniref:hypothetical protein n=1 Tax=Melissospora conviva TaxID=3388432 RepID=UPI003C186266
MQKMTIPKQVILDALRNRGQQARADWFDRELPEQVDLARNSSLLTTLGLDADVLRETARQAA